jgi:hypothetical protein
MVIKSNFPDRLQVRLTSSVELIRASLEPYLEWIEEMIGVPLDQTLTLEVDADPGDAVAERLLPGLPLSAGTKTRNRVPAHGRQSDDGQFESFPPHVESKVAPTP